jgi:hypothetical protein
MFVIEGSHAVVHHILRRFTAGVLVCLPALILILSAAPGSCPGGSCADDLSAPATTLVETLP